MQQLKKQVERLKRGGYESGIHRLYENLAKGGEITLRELSLVGSTEKPRNTTIIVGGEITEDRIKMAMQQARDKSQKK